ncbi:MAG: mechanosensitive ion channel family protein [Capnocytophaga sp.]|nr:mechanosensitive ion channel family protein [Capnocytophaga sp.]
MGEKAVIEYFKDFHILISIAVTLAVMFAVVYLFNHITNRYIRNLLLSHERDVTGFQFFKHLVTGIIYVLGIAAALSQIPPLKTIGHSLLAGAGLVSVVIGLAAQPSLGNLFSGVMIVIFRPFRINDHISIEGKTGYVEDINMRQVVLRDTENNRIVIPNSVVNGQIITNSYMNDTLKRNRFDIGIGYSSDIDKAFAIIREEAENHPYCTDNRSESDKEKNRPIVPVYLTELADSSVNLSAWIWTKNRSDGFYMLCDLRKSVKKRFDAEGIEIPFAQTTVSFATPLKQE